MVETRDAEVFLDEVVAKGGAAIEVRGLRLNTRRRAVAQPVVLEWSGDCVVDLPVELGEVEHLVGVRAARCRGRRR